MDKILVVCESSGKITKLQNILGPEYNIKACLGHIIDLESNNFSVEIENNFNPIYKPIPGKEQLIKDLKSAAKKSKQVLIASDPDREGEFIAWSLAKILNLPKNISNRIIFHSITKDEIKSAVKTPQPINNKLVDAQKGRRILDRIVGYELSPLLSKNLAINKLSAGRVQSVVVRLIIDRESDIKSLMESELNSYFKTKTIFNINNQELISDLYNLDSINKNIYKGSLAKLPTELETTNFINNIYSKSEFKINNIQEKSRIQSPSPPFTTSTIQQEASRRFGFAARRTMVAAQKLYEAGHITYMRTDSVNLSLEALNNIQEYIIQNFGENYYRRLEYKSKSNNTQEAHEAIRPTDSFTENIPESEKIGADEQKLYSLIWKRTIASQIKPAIFDIINIQISISKSDKYFFESSLENLKFDGYLIIYKEMPDPDNPPDPVQNITPPKLSDKLIPISLSATQEYDKIPGRYTEASLIDKMDPKNLNIGRPSTYAAILQKILDRSYVEIQDLPGLEKISIILNHQNNKLDKTSKKIILAKEKKKFVPTNLGININKFLLDNFPNIMDYKFTADMENKLDLISSGESDLNKILSDFYQNFHPNITKLINKGPDRGRLVGIHPEKQVEIYAAMAKYGPVIKYTDSDNKIYYAPIKEPLTLETINLDQAVELFSYPKNIGQYNKKPILINRGKYGYYLTCGTLHGACPENTDLKSATEILNSLKTGIFIPHDAKNLGIHPEKKSEIYLINTKNGAALNMIYNYKKIWVNIPENISPDNIKLADAVALFEFPKILGKLENKDIILNNGQYGFYISFDNKNYNIPDKNITLEKAINLINIFKTKPYDENRFYSVNSGKYGPYILITDKTNKKLLTIPIPKNTDLTSIKSENIIKTIKKLLDK